MKLDSFTNKLLAVWMATKWAVTQTLFQHKNNQELTKLSEMARKSLSSLSFTCQQIRWIHEKLFPKNCPVHTNEFFEFLKWNFLKSFFKNARTTWHWQTPGPIHGRGNFLWNSFFFKKKEEIAPLTSVSEGSRRPTEVVSLSSLWLFQSNSINR